MAGIYIHVPFCKTRCIYCDFYSNTGNEHRTFLDALFREIELRNNYLNTRYIKTIYLGGGTPSQLSISELNAIFEELYKRFSIDSDVEITLEANPDDLTDDYIRSLHRLPINRLSIGVQTFDNQQLAFLKRRHSGKQAESVVKTCQDIGFQNISIDLMYGLPKQSIKNFRTNIEKAVALEVPHISAYHLIYEDDTKLFRLLRRGEVRPADEELSVVMFSLLIKLLKEAGFEHYEISNFARNKLYSKHNTAYWQNVPYLGLGPSAHSYNGAERQWNVSSLTKYANALKHGNLDAEVEHETPEIRYNELILTGLRTMWGVDLNRLEREFGCDKLAYCLKNARPHLQNEQLIIEENHLCLSPSGFFVSDGIMSDLMWV